MAASASRAIYKSNMRSETTHTAGARAQGRARCSSTECHIRTAASGNVINQRAQTKLTLTARWSLQRNHSIPKGSFSNSGTSPCQANTQVTLMPTARHSRSAPAYWDPSLARGQLTWQRLHKAGTGSEQLAKACSVRAQCVLPWKGPAQAPSLSPTCRTRSGLAGLQLST